MDSHPQDAAERLTLASVGEAAPGRRGRFVRGRPGERPVKLSLLMPVYNEERTI
jgi:hypothetical protein